VTDSKLSNPSREIATEISLYDGEGFGYPYRYLLQVTFNSAASLPFKIAGYWRVGFVLQSLRGKL
jgi:hypothetical protein